MGPLTEDDGAPSLVGDFGGDFDLVSRYIHANGVVRLTRTGREPEVGLEPTVEDVADTLCLFPRTADGPPCAMPFAD